MTTCSEERITRSPYTMKHNCTKLQISCLALGDSYSIAFFLAFLLLDTTEIVYESGVAVMQ